MIFWHCAYIFSNCSGSNQEEWDISTLRVLIKSFLIGVFIYGLLYPSQDELQIFQCSVISGISVTIGKAFYLSYSVINCCIFHLTNCHL